MSVTNAVPCVIQTLGTLLATASRLLQLYRAFAFVPLKKKNRRFFRPSDSQTVVRRPRGRAEGLIQGVSLGVPGAPTIHLISQQDLSSGLCPL